MGGSKDLDEAEGKIFGSSIQCPSPLLALEDEIILYRLCLSIRLLCHASTIQAKQDPNDKDR